MWISSLYPSCNYACAAAAAAAAAAEVVSLMSQSCHSSRTNGIYEYSICYSRVPYIHHCTSNVTYSKPNAFSCDRI